MSSLQLYLAQLVFALAACGQYLFHLLHVCFHASDLCGVAIVGDSLESHMHLKHNVFCLILRFCFISYAGLPAWRRRGLEVAGSAQ